MKHAIFAAIAGLGIGFAGASAHAVSTADLNAGLLADTAGSWYFNFTAREPTDHHVPDGFVAATATDYTTADPGSLEYSGPVRADTTVVGGIELTITGFSSATLVVGAGTQSQIRHDYSGGSVNNGIGVMSTSGSSVEQVRFEEDEFLRLEFSDIIELAGFDFASGNHANCSASTRCGGFELYSFDGVTATSLTGATFHTHLDSASYVAFDTPFSGDDFLIRATETGNDNDHELGWYLSGVAGDRRVPEPGIIALFGVGLLGIGVMRRRRKAA
ncbi:MAG: PEP-CTERM sorting domain-containing protein [Alphaproteobacteria bacterium]|nr:PEP-CTERM sorting domain-containing protein [Alphaproteobacteria bacterium]